MIPCNAAVSMKILIVRWHQTTNLGVRSSNLFGRAIESIAYAPTPGGLCSRGNRPLVERS